MFDPMGNYFFCAKCTCASFNILERRLTRQRNVKRQQSQLPVVTTKMFDVVEQRLGDYVVMPPSIEQPFLRWWRSLSDSVDVEVRFPHDHHGNAGKPSNSAKQTVREQFLSFVDANIQQNGRKADSSGPTHYFVPTFSSQKRMFQITKKGLGALSLENSIVYRQKMVKELVQMVQLIIGFTKTVQRSRYSPTNWTFATRVLNIMKK